MHKPTYFALKGRASVLPTRRTCVRDVIAHTKLKVRQPGQGGAAGLVEAGASSSRAHPVHTHTGLPGDEADDEASAQRRNQVMREQLLGRERDEQEKLERSKTDKDAIYLRNSERTSTTSSSKHVAGLLTDTAPAYDDRDAIEDEEEDEDEEPNAAKGKHGNNDEIGRGSDSGFDSSEDEEDDDGDDSDDEEALMAELAKIKAERAAAQQRRDSEEKHLEEIARREAAVSSNPLLDPDTLGSSGSGSGRLKRKWNDDVVFKNQASDEPTVQKRFINDTVRSDFHRAFMKKYIK